MNVDLNINPLINAGPVNQFKLALEFMHGDADGNSNFKYFYSNDEEGLKKLKEDLIGINTFAGRDTNTKVISEALEAHGVENAEDRAEEISEEFYESDMTCDGEWALLTDVTVTYFDMNGGEHSVEVKINGRTI